MAHEGRFDVQAGLLWPHEASASIPGNAGIQRGSRLQIHIFQVPLEHLLFVKEVE